MRSRGGPPSRSPVRILSGLNGAVFFPPAQRVSRALLFQFVVHLIGLGSVGSGMNGSGIRHIVVLIVLMASSAAAQVDRAPWPRARDEARPDTRVEGRGTPLGPICFYGGDLDFRAAVSSDRNTAITDSWTFDDVDWTGGIVTEVWGHFVSNRDTGVPVAGDVAVYQGMAEGIWGQQVIEIWDVTDGLMWTPTGNVFGARDEYKLRFNVRFYLPPGSYHVGVRPVGTGRGQNFITSTSGDNARGVPIGNGNSFFQSQFFGIPLPTDMQNIKGAGTWDFSFGLCGVSDPGVTLSLEGECPGAMRARLSGATPGGRVALIRSAPGGCAGQTTIPPSNPCSGTVLPLGGAALVRIISADGNGEASLTGNVPNSICGRICLIALDLATCEVSNAVEF